MRQLVAILGVTLLLLGPSSEYLHDHDLGHAEGDCVACQTARTPVVAHDLVPVLVPMHAVTATLAVEGDSPLTPQEPLRHAPKTSPPPRG